MSTACATDEVEKDELELLAQEFNVLKCSQGTGADQRTKSEERTLAIRVRVRELTEELEETEGQNEVFVRWQNLSGLDCAEAVNE
jgi:hypothetical protein